MRYRLQSCNHLGALNLSHTLPSLSYKVLIFTWVKSSIWEWSALLKDTTSNNVPRLREEKHNITLKILQQAGLKTARQAATSAERHALLIAPRPTLVTKHMSAHHLQYEFLPKFFLFQVQIKRLKTVMDAIRALWSNIHQIMFFRCLKTVDKHA